MTGTGPALDAPAPMRLAPTERPLDIVLAYSRLPLPMTRADQMTVAHLIEFLAARGHRVALFALDNGEPMTADGRDWLVRRCRRVELIRHRLPVRALGLVLGLMRGQPMQVGLFTSRRQRRLVQEALCGADLGYCYYIRSAEAMRGAARAGKAPTFLAMQLAQSLNTRRMVETYRSLKERAIYALESRLVRGYEARIWRDFTRVVLIGERDAAEIRAACRERGLPEIDNVVFGPHGLDVRRFAPRPASVAEPYTLVFNGVLRTHTNVHAITWFASEVWPQIKAAEGRARLLVVGREPKPAVRALGRRDGVTVTGEVADPAAWIARATVCINPVQAGAGMQNKLLEYMAMAKPVVATSVANEGIGANPDEHLVIADGAASFAQAILALFADPERAQSLGRAAHDFVVANWTWEAHFLRLEAAMQAVVGEGAGR